MKLSVIILTCDKDYKYLNTCIESVKKYVKFETYEIIVVDNRSDTSEELRFNNVKVFKNTGNKFTFESRKFGFNNSCGDYIYYVDADDELIDTLDENRIDDEHLIFHFDAKYQGKPGEISDTPLPAQALWAYILDRRLQEIVYSCMDEEVSLCTNEDVSLISLCKVLTDKEILKNEGFYLYNMYRSGYRPVPNEDELKAKKIILPRVKLRLLRYVNRNGKL